MTTNVVALNVEARKRINANTKFKFTNTSLKDVIDSMPENEPFTLRDSEVVGFVVRKQKKAPMLGVEVKVRGKVRRVSIQEYEPGLNIQSIRNVAARHIADLRDGSFVTNELRREGLSQVDDLQSMTIGDAIALHSKMNPRTRATTIDTYKRQIGAAFGLSKKMITVTDQKVRNWYQSRQEQGASTTGLNSTIGGFKAVWNTWADVFPDEFKPKENPVSAFAGRKGKNLAPNERKDRDIPANLTAAFITAAINEMHTGGQNGSTAASIAFTAVTGLRASEVRSITPNNIRAKAIIIDGEHNKGGVDIIRPITPLMRTIIEHQLEHKKGDKLFPVGDLRKGFARILKVAGITDNITSHDLRRTYLRTAEVIGVPVVAQKLLVGHKLSGVTEGYQKGVQRELPRFADAVEAELLRTDFDDDLENDWMK